MRRKLLGIAGAALILLSPFVVHWIHRNAGIAVDVAHGKDRVIRDSVLASGSLIYNDEALLSPEVIGRVISVFVKEGDHVKLGDVVVKIDDQTYRDAVAQQISTMRAQRDDLNEKELDLTNKRIQLDRFRSLLPRGYISKTDYDSSYYAFEDANVAVQLSRDKLEQEKALLRQQYELLAKTIIRAPMSGTVVAVSIKPGETAVPSAIGIPGSSLVAIANTRSLMVDLNVDESDITHLTLGQSVAIHCPPLPDAALSGSIKSIALAPRRGELGMGGGADARSYSVKVAISDKRAKPLRPGMNCRAEIYTSDPPPTFSVPVQAVLSLHPDDSDGLAGDVASTAAKGPYYVFVDSDGYARRRVVELGVADDSYQEIKRGLVPGDEVICGPYRSLNMLSDGDRVHSRSAD